MQTFARRILAADPAATVTLALAREHKRTSRQANGIGYGEGGHILCRLSGLRSSASLALYSCAELRQLVDSRLAKEGVSSNG